MRKWLLALLLLGMVAVPARAQGVKPIPGPTVVTLGSNLATVNVPKGILYFNKDDTQTLLRKSKNLVSGNEVGAFVSSSRDDHFAIVAEYEDEGHVKDDDAGKINADDLLKQLKDGNEDANADRKKQGYPELHVMSWADPPGYDAVRHQLHWAINVQGDRGKSVNYFVRALGRTGVLSFDLICDPSLLNPSKTHLDALMDKTAYLAGNRYEDFKVGDHDSGKNLTGLILGGGALAVAAKLGLFAKLGKLLIWVLLAFKKMIIVGVAAVGSFFAKLRGKKKVEFASGAPPPTPPQDPPAAA
ncbi:MAG: DUF2167 domain-containing protein [Candidatus Xenobia bacterium]